MINQKTLPTVFHDADGTFSDFSIDAVSFGRDSFALPLKAATDAFYFGLWKPFANVFVEMAIPNLETVTFLAEYWDGSAWVIVDNLLDDTKGFQRSGNLQWDRPGKAWKENTVNNKSAFWIRLTPDADFTVDPTFDPEADPIPESIVPRVQGMGVLFSDDQDLRAVYPAVMNLLDDSEISFVLRHENARDDIVQFIRNSGIMKSSKELGVHDEIEAWDLLVIEEVRAWSKYLALSNIFSGVQSKEKGMWKEKSEEYEEKAENAKAAFFLSLDRNDDGIKDPEESLGRIDTVSLVRR